MLHVEILAFPGFLCFINGRGGLQLPKARVRNRNMPKKSNRSGSKNTPVFFLDLFSQKAGGISFYMEKFKVHVKDHAFINRPHKHDFYLILFITRGQGTHTIDFQTYRVAPGTVFMMTPGQVHSWKLSNDADGYIIFFKPEFYQMQLHEDALVAFPFFHSLNSTPYMKFGNDRITDVVLDEMYHEFKKGQQPDLRMLRTYLDIVLLKLAHRYKPQNTIELNAAIFKLRKVEELIEKNYIKLKHPSDYASLMNLTPSYLNNICKVNLGKTLSDLIHGRIILEAKRLFSYTDLSVKEVAHHLGYTDSAYFTRFFRKNAGLTPDQFKASINSPV